MRWLPIMISPPLVLLAVFTHPAQSLSVYATAVFTFFCHPYLSTSLGHPFRYLPILITPCQSEVLGLDIDLAISLAAYCMSGRSPVM